MEQENGFVTGFFAGGTDTVSSDSDSFRTSQSDVCDDQEEDTAEVDGDGGGGGGDVGGDLLQVMI